MQHLIRYLHNCYEADRSGINVWNLLRESADNMFLVDGSEQIINGLLPYIAAPPDQAESMAKAARLYAKEKQLVYGSVFVCGQRTPRNGKPGPMCSPLLTFPATFDVVNDIHVVRADLDQRTVNYVLLEELCANTALANQAYEQLQLEVPVALSDFSALHTLYAIMQNAVPDLQLDALFQFPTLFDRPHLEQASRDQRASLVPGSACLLAPRSRSSRGVLHELTTMTGQQDLSDPVKRLLDENATHTVRNRDLAPPTAILSDRQTSILRNAAHAPLSVAVGPPGTGKSFTIAAAALEHLANDETVLIVSRMSHAVDVVATMLEEQLGPSTAIVRGGARHYQKDLQRYLSQLLQGNVPGHDDKGDVQHARQRLRDTAGTVARLEKLMDRHCRWSIKWGRWLQQHESTSSTIAWWQRSVQQYLTWRLGGNSNGMGLAHHLHHALMERSSAAADWIRIQNSRRLERVLANHRKDLTSFLKGLRSRTGTRQMEMFQQADFNALLHAFPIWVAELTNLDKVLPLYPSLFDVVIIDEATQCDIPSSLPALQRAKRCVVVGDPNQLRHVSFLSRQKQKTLAIDQELSDSEQEELDYRSRSVLDLALDRVTTQDHVVFLDEHFRSQPGIIRFSNQAFYANRLKIMTTRPHAGRTRSIHFHQLDDASADEPATTRNEAEAAYVADAVADIIQQQSAWSARHCSSIGLLSPFRDQADLLERHIQNRFSLEQIQQHKIMVGTAHTFQGEERDVMFLSFAVTPRSHSGTVRFLNRRDQFNVAITRARTSQHVVVSCRTNQLPTDNLLRRFLDEHDAHTRSDAAHQPEFDAFAGDVTQALATMGLSVWQDYPVAGMIMDLLVCNGDRYWVVDLIGYPGHQAGAYGAERYRVLHRAGLPVMLLSYPAWRLQKEHCLQQIHDYTSHPDQAIVHVADGNM